MGGEPRCGGVAVWTEKSGSARETRPTKDYGAGTSMYDA